MPSPFADSEIRTRLFIDWAVKPCLTPVIFLALLRQPAALLLILLGGLVCIRSSWVMLLCTAPSLMGQSPFNTRSSENLVFQLGCELTRSERASAVE